MTSRIAAHLVRLYPPCWRIRYGQEFSALLEQHPFSFKTLVDVFCSAVAAHIHAAISRERNQGIIVGSVWSAWMIAVIAGLILYGMIDDAPQLASMHENVAFAASWKVVQIGCAIAVSAIITAGLPLASSLCLYVLRRRERGIYLRLAIPFISILVLAGWTATVLFLTGGHWAASPWAVAFSRPEWPSYSVRWFTGSITAIILVTGCFASAASISRVLRGTQFPDLRIAISHVDINLNPLSFAAALAPWAATGIFVMLSGVAIWGYMASRLSARVFRSLNGPLGLSGLHSWILSTIILSFAAVISARAAWRSRALTTDL